MALPLSLSTLGFREVPCLIPAGVHTGISHPSSAPGCERRRACNSGDGCCVGCRSVTSRLSDRGARPKRNKERVNTTSSKPAAVAILAVGFPRQVSGGEACVGEWPGIC